MESSIAGYILAGGKNHRMGGKKKLFLTYREKTFYQWLVEGLGVLGKIYLSVEDTRPYEEVDEELVVDKYSGTGPVGGIVSGLLTCREEALLIVPCDMIPLPADMITYMLEVYQEKQLPLMLKTKGRTLPFPGIYKKEMIPVLIKMLEMKNYRASDIWEQFFGVYMTINIEDFRENNINTRGDYEAMNKEIRD